MVKAMQLLHYFHYFCHSNAYRFYTLLQKSLLQEMCQNNYHFFYVSQLRDVEEAKLHSLIRNKPSSEMQSIVYNVLQQRHFRERVQLASHHERERQLAIEELKAKVKDGRMEERGRLLAEQEKEIIQLLSNPSSPLGKQELAQHKLETKKNQKRKNLLFDKQTEEAVADVEAKAFPELDMKQNEDLLQMRDRQIKELAEAMEKVSPEEVIM